MRNKLNKVLGINKNSLYTSVNKVTNSNINAANIKNNYKSTPLMKNKNLNLNEENQKNLHCSSNINVNKYTEYKAIELEKKATPKNTNHPLPRSANINLWRKPVIIAGNSTSANQNNVIQSTSNYNSANINSHGNYLSNNYNSAGSNYGSNAELKSSLKIKNKNQVKIVPQNLHTNPISTNYTDIKREDKENSVEDIQSHIKQQNDLGKNRDYISKVRKSSLLRKNKTVKETTTSHTKSGSKVSRDLSTPLVESSKMSCEIVRSIANLKSIMQFGNIKDKKYDNIFRSEEEALEIHNLNSKLNQYGSASFMDDKQDTSKYSKINVINSDMFNDENNNLSPKKPIERKMNEIQSNSELRMKKYEILLGFINGQLKEINTLVQLPQQSTTSHGTTQQMVDEYVLREDLNKIEEENSNKLSSLHSKINLNSNVYEKDEYSYFNIQAEVIENSVFQLSKYLNSHKRHRRSMIDPAQSFFISSINSDYYQNLLDESFLNVKDNFDLSSIKTNIEAQKKFEGVVGNSLDKTPKQYQINKREFISEVIPRKLAEEVIFNDNSDEECNVEEDLDKTKENIHALNVREFTYNQVSRDIDRIKAFVNIILKLE